MDASPRLSLSYLQPLQAQKHVTVNDALRRLDALVSLAVKSRTTDAEPPSPAEGDAYVMTASPAGAAWTGFAPNAVAAFQDGAWVEIAPTEGLRAYVADEAALVVFDGAAWSQVSGGAGGGGPFTELGVNATPDTTNRLSVKSDAILFSYDDVTPGNDDCILKVNKKTATDTASVLFQTAFSGRAELGLTGDDDFHVKVSPDGSSWTTAMTVDKDNGRIGLGTTAPTHVLTVEGADSATSRLSLTRTTSPSGTFQVGGNGGGLFICLAPVGTARFSLFTRRSGPTDVEAFRADNDGSFVVGTPTGGGKGAGTINAKAVYDDNSLLSCYVFDQALDGNIDHAKWDGKAPDRITAAEWDLDREIETMPSQTVPTVHEPMRKFAARAGTPHDPLTLDGYARHWKEKRHLTAMPNEATFDPRKGMSAGEWIQRLVETVEIQAVLIEKLNERTKALAARR